MDNPRVQASTPIHAENIPAELKEGRHFIVWRYEPDKSGKPTKVPYQPHNPTQKARSNDPATWAPFFAALAAYQRGGFDGIGYQLGDSSPYTGVDLDHCIDDAGNVAPWAAEYVEGLQSYTEITPSGHGLRVWVQGKLPPGGRKKGDIEMYDCQRFFTMTGNHWPGSPTAIQEREGVLAVLHTEVFGESNAPTEQVAPRPAAPVDLDDAALIDRASRSRKNGAEFAALWRGDSSGHNGDASAGDLALCSHLVFWAGGDEARVDRLFRQSGRMRPKWDERHYNDGRTYGQATIAKAMAGAREFYSPPKVQIAIQPNGHAPSTETSAEEETVDVEHPAPLACPALPVDATAIYEHLAPCGRWLDEYTEFAAVASPMTPHSFHEMAGLFAGAVAVARRLVLRVSTTSIYPNLFALFIAPSTEYSKTTGFRVLTDTLAAADMRHFLLPQRMTPEAMLQELSLGVPMNLGMGDQEARAAWLRERPFAAKRGWAIDEASSLFDALKRDFNTGLLPMMLNLYECPDKATEQTIGRWRVTVHNAYLSFFGAATPAAMQEHLASKTLWTNGLWARFAIIMPDEPPCFKFFPPELAIPQALIEGLQRLANLFPTPTANLLELEGADGEKRKAVEINGEEEPSGVLLAPGVWQAWKTYTRATRFDLVTTGELEEELKASYGRLGSHAIKVAMILAAFDADALPIRVEMAHLARAQQIVEQWRESLHRLRAVTATTQEETQADRLLAVLNAAGEQGCPTRDLYKPFHLAATEARRILDELAKQGQVECFQAIAPNGRKVERWKRLF